MQSKSLGEYDYYINITDQSYKLLDLPDVYLILVSRLDRLTSGLLMFGRNPGKAREMETQIRTRQVRKEYICRVEGDFPM